MQINNALSGPLTPYVSNQINSRFYHIPFKFHSRFANMMEVDEKMLCSILYERFGFKKHPDGNVQKRISLTYVVAYCIQSV